MKRIFFYNNYLFPELERFHTKPLEVVPTSRGGAGGGGRPWSQSVPASKVYTLPETNSSPLKMDGWKMNFLLGFGLFAGAKMLVLGRVGFRNGNFFSP